MGTVRWEFLERDLVRIALPSGSRLYLSPAANPRHAPEFIKRMKPYEFLPGNPNPRYSMIPVPVPNKCTASYVPMTAIKHLKFVPGHWFTELYNTETIGGYSHHSAEGVIKALILFRKRAGEWLKAAPCGLAGAIDSCLWLPIMGPSKSAGLADYLFKYRRSPSVLLRAISHAWPKIDAEGRKLAPRKMFSMLSPIFLSMYKGKHADLVLQAFYAGLGPSYYRRSIEERWFASQATPMLAEMRIERGGYVGRMLPRNDPRGLFLGMLTNCCQYPSSGASSAAWHGQESEDGGFFVVEDAKGNVVVQSWTWLSRKLRVCAFDSLESLGRITGERAALVSEIYQEAALRLKTEKNVDAVFAGPANKVDMGLPAIDMKETPLFARTQEEVFGMRVYSDFFCLLENETVRRLA
jgi:hypothetical protein